MRIRSAPGVAVITASIIALASPAPAGQRLHVDAGAPPGGDGATWPTALADLQDALAIAADPGSSVDTIWVAAGTYRPAPAGGDREISFVLSGGLALYGGFAGNETRLEQRDWTTNETILSGDLNGDDGPEFINYTDNSHHLLTCDGEAAPIVIDGFTIRGGSALEDASSAEEALGGALHLVECDVHFANCLLHENQATGGSGSLVPRGGAMYAASCTLSLSGCRVSSNRAIDLLLDPWARSQGGALSLLDCHTCIVGCTFEENLAATGGAIDVRAMTSTALTVSDCAFLANRVDGGTGAGGAIHGRLDSDYLPTDSLVVIDGTDFIGNAGLEGGAVAFAIWGEARVSGCRFVMNSAVAAGALEMFVLDEVLVQDCDFIGNEALMWGGGACVVRADHAELTRCRFIDNASDTFGGAVWVTPSLSQVGFRSCAFIGNTSAGAGGAVQSKGLSALFESCTFVGNRAATTGGALDLHGQWDCEGATIIRGCTVIGNVGTVAGAVANEGDQAIVHNSVIRGNGSDPLVEIETQYGEREAGITILSSNIEGGWSGAGAGLVDTDPLFVNAPAGDWRLAPGSPCIDAGDSSLVGPDDLLDVAGRPRVIGAAVDMGAHEFDDVCPADCADPPDGVVNVDDLIAVIIAWGEAGGARDVTYDGVVDVADLVAVLTSWGACP